MARLLHCPELTSPLGSPSAPTVLFYVAVKGSL